MKRNGDKPVVHMVPVGELVPSEYNPRSADEASVAELRASLQRFGMVDPLIVNGNAARRNRVIGGHFRLRVAQDMGMAEVPCVYVDIASEERERELNLRLNRNLGQWDWEKLAANFEMEFLTAAGFTEEELRLGFELQPTAEDMAAALQATIPGVVEGSRTLSFSLTEEEYAVARAALDLFTGKEREKFLALCTYASETRHNG